MWLLPDRTNANIIGDGGEPILLNKHKNDNQKLFIVIPIIGRIEIIQLEYDEWGVI